jgi:hypothetical protein
MREVAYLLALGALLATGQAGAGAPPRDAGKPTEAGNQPVSVESAVWSKRLLGRFKFDGVIHHEEIIDFSRYDDAPPEPDEGEVRGASLYVPEWSQPVEGKGDCVDFADGPGLQCVINVIWLEEWRVTGKAQLGGASDLTPAMVLTGLTPSTVPGGIRVLLVDKRGLGHPGALTLKGDAATVKLPCVNLPGVQTCDQRFTVTAKADASTIFVNLNTRVRFLRSKMDRKLFLGETSEGRMEKQTEWVEEILDVSFALHREPEAAQDQEAKTPPAAR